MALIRDIAKLEPATRALAETAVAVLKAQGIRFWINETLRLRSTQEAYYAQGRQSLEQVNALRAACKLWPITAAENQRTVTNTLKSKHLEGKAIDICPAKKDGSPWWTAPEPEWTKIASVMKACGFEWGGDWINPETGAKGWDKPHYQRKEK